VRCRSTVAAEALRSDLIWKVCVDFSKTIVELLP